MPKFYAVAVGREIGVFMTWNECEKQVKGYSGAKYKSFTTQKEAEEWKDANKRQMTKDQLKNGSSPNVKTKKSTCQKKKTKSSSSKQYSKTKKIREKEFWTEEDYNNLKFIGGGYHRRHSNYKRGK